MRSSLGIVASSAPRAAAGLGYPRTDFGEYATGVQPSDWTARWATSGWTASVVADATAPSGKALEINVTGSNALSLLSWDAVDAEGADRYDFEILTMFKQTGTTGFGTWLVGRGSGTEAARSGGVSAAHMNGAARGWRNFAYNSGGFVSINQNNTDLWTSGAWAWCRFRGNGNTIQSRTWIDGDAEPGTWTLSTTNTTFGGFAAGWLGVGGFDGANDYRFGFFSVGVSGATAPGL